MAVRGARILPRAPDLVVSGLNHGLNLGNDVFYSGTVAAAREAALKLKETCGLHAEAVSAAEIRHGPLALAGPELRVVVFAQRDAALAGSKQLADDVAARGSRVLLVTADGIALRS